MRRLQTGVAVSVDGPFGDFVLPEGDRRDVVFLAGDVGIAPVRSIVLHLLAERDPRKIYVFYEPDHRHILYAADFDPLARAGDIVHMSGKIEPLIERHRSVVKESLVMVAGFDSFLARANECLDGILVDRANVIGETFGPDPM